VSEPRPAIQHEAAEGKPRRFLRFDLSQRIEHIVMLTSFTVLAITGLPQKFPDAQISIGFFRLFGGIEPVRVIHRTSAVVLMLVSIYHVVGLLYRIFVRRVSWTMLPGLKDFKDLYQDLLAYFGVSGEKARYGRYSYAEKMEYLAVVWGIVIMAFTGFMMWNPILTTRILPGEFIPAAKAAHGAEAILAVLAILLWHFYHVHLRHFNRSMFIGYLTEHEMEEEHPAELERIIEGHIHRDPPPEIMRRRQRVFLPVAGVLSLLMLAGVAFYVTGEQTSIKTIPPGETVDVFVTAVPGPTPTLPPTPTGEAFVIHDQSWDGGFEALFRNRCGTCHGVTAVGGLSLQTYEKALQGGEDGPAIVPGDPEASLLVQVQRAGGHPGQLTDAELEQVIAWIAAGAPKQ
jgi:cytochrome b subunit of formate dehydrogenase/mono/diheme cytochrome c family protein